MELCFGKEIINKYTYSQCVSMLRILHDIIMADGKVDKREEELFTTISHQLGLDESVRIDVAAQNSLLALCDIRDFDISQKEEFAKMMGRMIVIDNDINYDEVRIYNVVNEFCDIKIEFNPDYIITQM